MNKNIKLEGYKKYEFLCLKIEALFDENELMGKYKLNISKFKKRYEKIKKDFDFEYKELESKELTPDAFKHDYETYSLNDINRNLNELIIEFNDYIKPIKNIYSLINAIKSLLELNVSEQIDTINKLSKELIDSVDNINNYDDEVIKLLVIESSDILYDVIMNGCSLGNNELINYIKTKEDSICEQLLTSKLRKDILNKTDKPFFGEIELSEDVIPSVMPTNEDIETKLEELDEVRNRIEEIKGNISNNNKRIEELKDIISKYKEKYSTSKKVGYSLGEKFCKSLPILTAASSIALCYALINNKCKNETKNYLTNIVYNDETNEVIKRKRISIPFIHGNDFNFICTVYSKWEKNPLNDQYYRKVLEYRKGEYDPTLELTEENLNEKFIYWDSKIEYKKELDENDSTEKGQIIVDAQLYEEDVYRPGFLAYSLSGLITYLCYRFGKRSQKKFREYLEKNYDFSKYDKDKKLVKLNEEEIEKLIKAVEQLKSELEASILKEEELSGYEISDIIQILSNKETNQVLKRHR